MSIVKNPYCISEGDCEVSFQEVSEKQHYLTIVCSYLFFLVKASEKS